MIKRVAQYPNLFVFRSLIKFYGIPGLRAAYMAGSAEAIARLVATKDLWMLSTPAIEAARACLAEHGYRQVTQEGIPLLRQQLGAGVLVRVCRNVHSLRWKT